MRLYRLWHMTLGNTLCAHHVTEDATEPNEVLCRQSSVNLLASIYVVKIDNLIDQHPLHVQTEQGYELRCSFIRCSNWILPQFQTKEFELDGHFLFIWRFDRLPWKSVPDPGLSGCQPIIWQKFCQNIEPRGRGRESLSPHRIRH